ncbi:MAG TPA: luciferase, partial [Candidatus Krumholzibacteria bacterium]|nr:luciferase [Candidatus Krumholzibacteria bacterium]
LMVFVNEEPQLSPTQRRAAATEEARAALGAYWTALEGTLDPSKVEKAADNAVVGNAEDVTAQILERFHPEDRLMLWFDFFNHDSRRVVSKMEAFMTRVAPRVRAASDR